MLLATAALAQHAHAPQHSHEALFADPAITISVALDAALERYPSMVEIAARREQADAWASRGQSLIAGRPQFSFRYQTDRYDADIGLQEFESGIQLPLWKWGERKSTRELGRAYDDATDAAHLALRWELAGLLRETIWQIAQADGEVAIAEQSVDVANRLLSTIQRRYELGDVALGDVLLAESAVLDAQASLGEAGASLVDAERSYRTLTLLDRRPEFAEERLSTKDSIETTHPALHFVAAELTGAKAARRLAKRNALVSPSLSIGPRRERPAFGDDFEDSVGVILTLPFGGGSHVRTGVAAAGRNVASAESDFRLAARELDLMMHEAAHGLSMAQSNLALATSRADLAERSYSMGESAYAKGELGLIGLLNLRAVLLDAQRQALRFDVETKRQTALYNQAVGVFP